MPEPTPTTVLDTDDLERRLDALARHGAARAALPPAGVVRAHATGELRRRRWAATAVVAAAAAVAGFVVLGPVAHDRDVDLPAGPVPHRQDPPLATSPVPGEGTVALSPTVSVTLPDGWRVYRSVGVRPGDPTQYSCVSPARAWTEGLGCPGLRVQAGRRLTGHEGGAYRPHQASGWYTGTDVGPCPVGPLPADGSFNPVTDSGGAPVEQGLRAVGGRQADYDRWRASCEDGTTFFPQAWYLPEFRLLLETAAPVMGFKELLAGIHLDGPAAAVGMPTQVEGRLVAATPGEVEVAVAGTRTRYRLTTTTACLGGPRLAGTSYDVSPVACPAFAEWLAAHPDDRLDVVVQVLDGGAVSQLAERT